MAGAVYEVKFSDGEGIVTDDLNNTQRFRTAYVNDVLLGYLARTAEVTYNAASTLYCYSWGVGGYPRVSAAARTLDTLGGVLAQKVSLSVPTGDVPHLLVYYAAVNALQTQFSVGDPADPRIDSIFIKLDEYDDPADIEVRDFEDATTRLLSSQNFVKKKSVRLQKQVVEGTPAAVPTRPAAPAGYVRYCDVYIPAAWGAADLVDPKNVRDERMPIGFEHIFQPASRAEIYSGWTIDAIGFAKSAGVGDVLYYPLPATAYAMARPLRIHVRAALAGAGSLTVELVRRYYNLGAGAGVDTVLQDFSAAFVGDGAYELVPDTIADAAHPGAKVVWGNGWTAGSTAYLDQTAGDETNGSRTWLALRITSTAAAQWLDNVRWAVARPVG